MLARAISRLTQFTQTLVPVALPFGTLCLVVSLSACSAFTGKSNFEAFVDGDPYPVKSAPKKKKVKENPESENVAKKTSGGIYGFMGDSRETGSDISNRTAAHDEGTELAQPKPGSVADEPPPHIDKVSDIILETDEARCLAEQNPSFSYRKRVAVLPMELQNRQHSVDMPYVEREYSQALTHKLTGVGLLAKDATAYHRLQAHPTHSRLHSPISAEQIRETAADLESQFLVTGRLVDLSFDRTDAHAIDLVTRQKFWKALARKTYERATGSYWRQFNVELSVYDGPSGALIKRQRYSGEANHPVTAVQNYGMDTNVFWQSDYGELVGDMLDQQSEMVSRALECLPLRAQVSRVDTDVIEINAGVDSLLMPGDRLRIFHREPAGRDPLGVPKHRWKYYGGVTIVGVFPLKSIATLDEGLAPDVIKLGDIVQAW